MTFEEWHVKHLHEVFADPKEYDRVVWNAAQRAMRERAAKKCDCAVENARSNRHRDLEIEGQYCTAKVLADEIRALEPE